MKKFGLPYRTALLLAIGLAFSCRPGTTTQRLTVEKRNRFEALDFVKIFEIDLYGRWCLPCPQGIVCSEILDRTNRAYRFSLYDYSGALIRKREVLAGQGPSEIQGGNLETVWLSPTGKIFCLDVGDYLKSIDPETLKIETIVKLSNVVHGYGSRFDIGRISGSSLEEKDGQLVTTFESSGFPDDFTYYLVHCSETFQNLSVIASAKKEKPLSWKKLEESRQKGGLLENIVDYYDRLRLLRSFAVDWKRDTAYLIPDIEKPEIERIELKTKRKTRFSIDIDVKEFSIEREEFDSFFEYVMSERPEILKQRFKSTLYIPPHAPTLMGAMVVDDRLLLITGNRNWKSGENETLVYRLPEMQYQGSFFVPYPNTQHIKWTAPYYIVSNRVQKNDDYLWRYTIYQIKPQNGSRRDR